MQFNWFEGIIFGLFSGLSEIFPVSSQAHRFLMLKLFGSRSTSEPALMGLLIDLAILAALYYSCQNHIVRMLRASRLARVPKKRRKRPLDTRSLMDLSLVKTMLIPAILVLILYNRIKSMGISMILVAIFLFINGIILYLPQFFPGANRDSRTMSRVQGIMIGLSGSLSVFPGISGMGAALSVSSVCGVDRAYGLNMALLLNMGVYAGFTVYDIIEIALVGMDTTSFGGFIISVLSALSAFGGTILGVKVMRNLSANIGYGLFAYYCWGLALFAFIINLLA